MLSLATTNGQQAEKRVLAIPEDLLAPLLMQGRKLHLRNSSM
jgi:hypothetical protein